MSDDTDCSGYNDDNDVENYTLVVTERSSNDNCALPTDKQQSSIELCLGRVVEDGLIAGDQFTLDVTYLRGNIAVEEYSINQIDFDIFYDAEFFSSDLTYQEEDIAIADEVSFELTNQDDSSIHVTAISTTNLKHSGLLMTIPFTLNSDVDENVYEFGLNFEGALISDEGDVLDEENIIELESVNGFLEMLN